MMTEKDYKLSNCAVTINNLRSYRFPFGTQIIIPCERDFADESFREDFLKELKRIDAASELDDDGCHITITL